MEDDQESRRKKQGNNVQTWGNATTMNINTMIHTNILSSPYFKKNLFALKTYHEVVDEIYYKVGHLEPWEKGSRKTSGQVGMCGGVRGVGAGGIVSSCFCLLFKLFTLKLTRKQLKGLIDHCDSPYIRGIGFMYIRYCIQPRDMWSWVEPYLEDEEELDVKAGGGCIMTVGQLVRSFLLRLEWYGTLFPRIPVPVEKEIRERLTQLNLCDDHKRKADDSWGEAERQSRSRRDEDDSFNPKSDNDFGEAERFARQHRRSRSRDQSRERAVRGNEHQQTRRSHSPDRSRAKPNRSARDSSRERRGGRGLELSRERTVGGGKDYSRERHPGRSRSRDRIGQRTDHKARSRDRSRDRSFRNGKERSHRSRSRERSSRDRHKVVHRSDSKERAASERRDKSHKNIIEDHVPKEKQSHRRRHEERDRRSRSRERSRERRKRSHSENELRERDYSEKKGRRLHEHPPTKEADADRKGHKESLHEPKSGEKKPRERESDSHFLRESRGDKKSSDVANVSDKNIDGSVKSEESVELEAGELRDDEKIAPKHKKKKKKKDREEKKSKDRDKNEENIIKKHKSKKSKRKHKDTELSVQGVL